MQKIIRRTAQTTSSIYQAALPDILKRVYAARGISDPTEIDYRLELLPNPALLKNSDLACDLLMTALKNSTAILIVGDYDADGATSTAVAMLALKSMGFKNLNYLIPDRFRFGYGLSRDLVLFAQEKFAPQLIITVDNGIASNDGVAAANELNIQVLITDHHLPAETLPAAAAIVNPNQPGDTFPSKNLAGVGVIFYLMLALRGKLRTAQWFNEQRLPEPNLAQFLDLVALGTVADLVTLDFCNRLLVKQGLQRINKGALRPGIAALLKITKRLPANCSATDLAFAVAPRLNAAGRIDDMALGVNCLVTDSAAEADNIALKLHTLNEERRNIENSMKQEAFITVSQLKLDQNLPTALCVFDEKWHQGVVGLLASRLKDKINRPVIAFAPSDGEQLKGSARSINGLHLRDLLENIANHHPTLIERFGGHAMAAGLTIRRENYAKFAMLFDAEAKKHLSADDLHHTIHSDGELPAEELVIKTAEAIRAGGPWGQGFAEPLFDGNFQLVEQRLVGNKHLKMTLKLAERPMFFDAIYFNVDLKRWPNERCRKIFAVYRLDINEYLDRRNLQLIVEHLQEM